MDIAIVGAGIGGLTTALLLTKQGHQVTLYEKEAELGGRLTFHRHGDYRIDKGPTIVLLPEMIKKVLKEAGVEPDVLDLIPCDPLYDLHFEDGLTFTKWRDQDQQLAELERCFPGESASFLQFMNALQATFETGEQAFLSRLFLKKRDFFTYTNIKLLLKSRANRTAERNVRRFFRDTRLQDAYALQTLYIGGTPHQTPALYSLISYSEHAHGIWYLRGGYASFVEQLEKECRTRGVQILKNTKIDEILVKDGVCTGVRVESERFHHEAVIYNGDFPHLSGLLTDQVSREKRTFRPSTGCLLIYVGVRKRWSKAKMHQFFMPSTFDRHMRQAAKGRELPEHPAFYVFNPVALDSEAAPPNESVLYFLVPVSSATSALSNEAFQPLVDYCLKEAEQRVFKDLKEHVTWLDYRTPGDALKEGLYGGGSFGLAPTLRQSGGFRPQVAPYKIRRLYCVGASVHPGGGIPIVMQGAWLLSQFLEKELKGC